MNLRDAAEIVNASTDAASRVPREVPREEWAPANITRHAVQVPPLPRRRTPRMILADIQASLAAANGLLRELEGRMGDE